MALCRCSDGLLYKINISKTFRSPPSAVTLFPGLKMDLMHLLLSPTPSFAHMEAKACFPCRRNPRGLQRAEPGTIYILAIGLMRLMYSTNLPAQQLRQLTLRIFPTGDRLSNFSAFADITQTKVIWAGGAIHTIHFLTDMRVEYRTAKVACLKRCLMTAAPFSPSKASSLHGPQMSGDLVFFSQRKEGGAKGAARLEDRRG